MKELNLLREITEHQPFFNWMKMELLEAGPGWVRERLPVRNDFLQPAVVHGGVIYAIADMVAAHAGLTLIYPEQWITTVEQKINFLRPVRNGAMVGYGHVIHMGNSLVYSEAEIRNDAGELVAKSTATLKRIAPAIRS